MGNKGTKIIRREIILHFIEQTLLMLFLLSSSVSQPVSWYSLSKDTSLVVPVAIKAALT